MNAKKVQMAVANCALTPLEVTHAIVAPVSDFYQMDSLVMVSLIYDY